MPNAQEILPGKSPNKQDASEEPKARIRIGRACDRCKLKKSKCDGNSPCSSCTSSESVCEYSARRRREARDWYWEMREVIDEALQTLYWACREGRGFPGTIPDESDGQVSTDAILRGLGLTPPAVERTGAASSASKRLPDESDGAPERSYHPPDIPPDYRSIKGTSVTQMQPSDRPENPSIDNRIGQEEYQSVSRTELNSSNHDLVSGMVPDNLDPRFRVLLDGDFDPAVFHHDNDRTMDFDHVESTDVSNPDVHSTSQWSHSYGYRSRELNQEDQLSVAHLDESSGNRQNPNWAGDDVPRSSETLPWPGTLAALSRNKKHSTRSGFDPPSSQ